MAERTRIYGSEWSPYSVKIRSYFRYKRLPHDWIVRTPANEAEFRGLAKLPLVPLVVAPDGAAMQDSTLIIETLEQRFAEPAVQPAEPGLAFLSALIEEYADEWGNKPMFHYRWWREVDRRDAATRLARDQAEGAEPSAAQIDALDQRQTGRLPLVGSTAATAALIERAFSDLPPLLEAHLAARPYLFGGRPALADFGLAAQLYEMLTDPTPGALLRAQAPRTVAYIERMLAPVAAGAFEAWGDLAPTLTPILGEQVGRYYLPWAAANQRAVHAGEPRFAVTLAGVAFTQEVQKYAAKSLGALQRKYAAAQLDEAMRATLASIGPRHALEPD